MWIVDVVISFSFFLSLEILVQSENRVSAVWSSNRPHCNGLKSLCGDEPKISRLIVQYVLTSNVSKLWRCSIVSGGSIPNILYIVCFLNAFDYHIFNCTRPWFLLCMFFQFYVVVFVFECRSKGLFSSFLFFFLLLRFSSRSDAKYRGSSSFFSFLFFFGSPARILVTLRLSQSCELDHFRTIDSVEDTKFHVSTSFKRRARKETACVTAMRTVNLGSVDARDIPT